jgi:hypothetical protein
MPNHASSSPDTLASGKAKSVRARSLPSARPYRIAVFFSSLHFLGIVALITSFACVFIDPKQAAVRVMVGSMGFCAVTWLIAFFKRRGTFCPLCKGTPLINSGARVHSRAWRLYPLNHGVTAILSIMATQRFRCMYCGSDYDLLKPRTRLLYGDAEGCDSDDCSHGKRR